jgi:hypothetical protein
LNSDDGAIASPNLTIGTGDCWRRETKHFGFREAYQVNARQPSGNVHLDGHAWRGNPGERAAVHNRDRHGKARGNTGNTCAAAGGQP